MGVKINTEELQCILDMTPPEHNIMLVGAHGIGKSEIIRNYYGERGQRVVSLFLGQMSDPGDLLGLPRLAGDRTEFMLPWWFPSDGKPVVLFLDELNRARPELLQTVMDLCLNKTLAGKRLPPGSRVVSAVNEGEEYQLTDLDPALVSRFNIYYFSPTPAEWLLWAQRRGIDSRVINFIEQNPNMLDGDVLSDGSLTRNADRRSWVRVSDFIAGVPEDGKIDRTVEKGIAGIAGPEAALKFVRFTQENSRLGAKAVLADFEAHKDELAALPPHELSALNEGIFRTLETAGESEGEETVKVYAENLAKHIQWLRELRRNEAVAHWTTLFESSAYPAAKVAILKYSPYIYQNIISFIEEIKL